MGEVRITDFFIRLWQIKKDRPWKTVLSDTSTGTLVLAENKGTGSVSIHWMNRSPEQMETRFLSSKSPNPGSVRAGKKLMTDLSLSLSAESSESNAYNSCTRKPMSLTLLCVTLGPGG